MGFLISTRLLCPRGVPDGLMLKNLRMILRGLHEKTYYDTWGEGAMVSIIVRSFLRDEEESVCHSMGKYASPMDSLPTNGQNSDLAQIC